MPRSGEEARERLRDAALQLYLEHGYDATTTAQIAARAGVNHRTFFRHFPDKREVLFAGEDDLRHALDESVRTAPVGLAPAAVLLRAFIGSAHILENNRGSGIGRLKLIATTPALHERDLAKGAAIIALLATALEHRGETTAAARLTAAVCWAVFHEAASAWIDNDSEPLTEHLRSAFRDLGELSASLRSTAPADR